MKYTTIILLTLSFALIGCGTHGPISAITTEPVATANKQIKTNVTNAKTDVNNVLKDAAIIARPDLTAALRDADAQLDMANATISQQATAISAVQKQADDAVTQGNAAVAALDATQPKHKRDLYALAFAYLFGAVLCAFGPLLFKAYPVLVFFPDFLESTVCAIAGFFVGSGIVGILLLFGVL